MAGKFNWTTVLGFFLGTAESIVPIFIHNPESQKVEGVVMTTTNNLFSTILQLQQQGTAVSTPTAATPTTPSK